MTILIVLIPLGLVMLGIAIAAFVWAVSNGQFDDLEGEGARILFEDDGPGDVEGIRSARRGDDE
jgi:cbb3-type cytochrome oxidase maturation protein